MFSVHRKQTPFVVVGSLKIYENLHDLGWYRRRLCGDFPTVFLYEVGACADPGILCQKTALTTFSVLNFTEGAQWLFQTKLYMYIFFIFFFFCGRDGVLILVLVLVLTRVLFSSTWLYSVLSEIHEYMYSYLLKYCYKKPCTHEYITSTTEYFFKFQSDRETVHCFSDPHSSVSNSPHLSFFIFEKSGLI